MITVARRPNDITRDDVDTKLERPFSEAPQTSTDCGAVPHRHGWLHRLYGSPPHIGELTLSH